MWMSARENNGTDVRISVCFINQFFQLPGNLLIQQGMRTTVDTSNEYRSMVFGIDVTFGLSGLATVHFTLHCFPILSFILKFV
jgi:hypothetical protein